MLKWKIEPLQALKEKGYTTYTLSKNHILNAGTIQSLREKQRIGWETIDKLCALLECQVGDMLEYIPDEQNNN